MQFNRHPDLTGRHSFLSASKYHWIRYSDERFDEVYKTNLKAIEGSRFHDLACDLIRMGVKLPRNKKTLNQYVNDALGFRMTPEQILYYSDNAFGTADAISFRDNFLRIHDLKTGVSRASVNQLEVYAAYFCLEYKFKPAEIGIELRIYQNDDVQIYEGDPDVITHIMDRIIIFDKRINQLREEAFG